MFTELADPTYRRDLGEGLILRWSTPGDAEDIAQLVSSVFRDAPDAPLHTPLGNLMRELMSGTHPLMGPGDFALVEDTQKQGSPLVACTCLWRQTWEYEGISFGVGRPEYVATDPAYRNRGLIRAIFELIHGRSEAEGHLVQGITGIPYFYRLFGYEYALDLEGTCYTYVSLIPGAAVDSPELFTLRDATWEDIPLVRQFYDRQRASSIVSVPIGEDWWRYQLAAWRTSQTGENWHIQMIIDADGKPQGYLVTLTMRWRRGIVPVINMAFASGANIQAIMPPILRALYAQGLQMPARDTNPAPVSRIAFILGRTHPVYNVLGKDLANRIDAPYAWYVCVANLPEFIRHIAPALERRLALSEVAGYSGELKLDFYRGGLRMAFDGGKLITVEDWRRPTWNANEDGGFPPLVFLQLLFGYRSLGELRYAFPDVWVNDGVELLVKALFPSRQSWVVPLG